MGQLLLGILGRQTSACSSWSYSPPPSWSPPCQSSPARVLGSTPTQLPAPSSTGVQTSGRQETTSNTSSSAQQGQPGIERWGCVTGLHRWQAVGREGQHHLLLHQQHLQQHHNHLHHHHQHHHQQQYQQQQYQHQMPQHKMLLKKP